MSSSPCLPRRSVLRSLAFAGASLAMPEWARGADAADGWERVIHCGFPPDAEGTPWTSPHRGFRYEMAMDAHDLSRTWDQRKVPLKTPFDLEAEWKTLEKDSLPGASVSQLYFYLWEHATEDLPDPTLKNIAAVLAAFRAGRRDAVLRFAYDDGVRPKRAYTVDHIRRHLEQLAPVVAEYSDVITVWQAGLLGAWGEWHGSHFRHETYADAVTAIMRSLVRALPPMIHTQVRYFDKREMVGDRETKKRIGYHNDYFTLGWGAYDYYLPGDKGWKSYLEVGQTLPVDGEMPWDRNQSKDPYAMSQVVDPLAAARRLQTLRFDTFSITHNATITLPAWRKTLLSAKQVRNAGLPAALDYFRDANGREVERPAYDYIRDHLGHRIEARATRWRRADGTLEVEIALANSGFAPPKRPREIRVVLTDASGRVASQVKCADDWREWKPSGRSEVEGESPEIPLHILRARLPLPEAPGKFGLGVLITDAGRDGRYGVRLANSDVVCRDGVNLLAEVEL